MPIYEYQCNGCGFKFEVFKKISENGNEKCPECSSKKVKRLMSSGGFILKGSGWYVTDYPSESRKKAMESEKKATTPSSPDAEKKATKPSTSDSPKKTEKKKTETKKTTPATPAK